MVHDALAVPRAALIGLEDRGGTGLVPATWWVRDNEAALRRSPLRCWNSCQGSPFRR
jgi:hypothetical protein